MDDDLTRRTFLKVAAASALLAGCNEYPKIDLDLPLVSAAQAAKKRKERSPIAIVQAEEYGDHLFSLIKPHLKNLDLPNLHGKKVLLKPNMVEFHEGKPITTHASVLYACAELVNHLGAKEIVIAEGPGHMRDTEFLLTKSGISDVCKKLGLQFLDLNLDDLVELGNPDGFSKFETVFLPKSAVEADILVSVPKMKCHHWVGITASMKNLLGCIPGRKYGWPKNQVHMYGIKGTTIDMVHWLKPTFALVDAIVAMEGDGPINGTPKHSGFMILGTDLAAIDATCARSMTIGINDLPYIQLAGEVIGNISPDMIDIHGASLASVTQVFEKPITLLDKSKLRGSSNSGS